MAKRQKRVPVQRSSSIDGAVSDGLSEVQELKQEMEDWASNMESSNMEHLPKYEEVNECKETLEEHADSEPTIPDAFPEGLEDKVDWQEPMAKRAGHISRALRLDQALAGVSAAKDHVQGFLDEHDDDDACWTEDCERSEWENYLSELETIVDGLEGVSFPGMY